MNLVVQGDDVDTIALKNLARAVGTSDIRQIHPQAFRLHGASASDDVASICAGARLDFAWIPDGLKLADFGLFVTDMDSTLIDIECIDEIADMQGLKAEVAAITEASMRGEIDFGESLTRRVALLEGLSENALASVYEQRLRLNPGAERLLRGLRAAGIHTMLVSGGFTYFTDRLRERLGFDQACANALEVRDGHLTGRIDGPMIDAQAKATQLRRVRDSLGLNSGQVIAAGDGANDIPMFEAAGFSVAFRAKPVLRKVSSCCFDHVGLDGILSLFE
nr:phosphoserine phosphatase SerB [Zoogloeaceae bacterium]